MKKRIVATMLILSMALFPAAEAADQLIPLLLLLRK